MTPEQKTQYQMLRKKHLTMRARDAYRAATTLSSVPPVDWHVNRSGEKTAELCLDGFTIRLACNYDYDYDWLDCRGKFASTWQEGAIKNPNRRYDRNVYEWFIPDTTEEEHYRELLKMNYGKVQAREEAHSYVQQDMQIACDPVQAGYYAVYVTAKATKEGIVLGHGSLYGIELSMDDSAESDAYISEVAWDVAHEAVSEAKAALARLLGKEQAE